MSSELPVGLGRRHAGIMLRLAYEAFTAALFKRLAEQGFDDLRPAHAQVFQHLKQDGVRLTQLARAAGVTPQSMSLPRTSTPSASRMVAFIRRA